MENKKSLKMSKGKPESINQRSTDNIMGKRKMEKKIYKLVHIKLKVE